jgi:thiosulfate/3-mercaptopyruvate sulfurtransferase
MFPLILTTLLMAAPGADVKAYAVPTMLVEPADASAKSFTIIDTRSKSTYDEGHVPGAVQLGVGPWGKVINAGKADAAFWKKELAAAGIGSKAVVLVYAEDIRDMCRAWWMFKLAGVHDVRVLNGGWKAYVAAKQTISKEAVKIQAADGFDWKPEPRLITKAEVVKLAEAKSGGLLDARSATEFADGRVPGATALEWKEVLDAESDQFLKPTQLADLMNKKKVKLDEPCVTYCQGGGRAAVLAFAMELMGAKNVKNYHASWGEYGADRDTPKEK